jgi:hypothetical protein
MSAIYYDNNLGNSSLSDGLNDFLLSGAIPYYNSLGNFKDKYIPYYIKHDTLNEWEIGLGIVIESVGQDVLVRSSNVLYPLAVVYSSSNNNNAVDFSAGSKTVVALISAERINHGGNNFVYQNSNFTADTVQTTYGVFASGSDVSAQLPSVSGNKNLVLSFKLLGDSSASLIINTSGLQLIDGQNSYTLTSDEKYTSLISDGSSWHLLNRDLSVDGSGLPGGSVGNIQYKQSSIEFGGDDSLYWDSVNKKLILGGLSSSNVILSASGNNNTVINNQQFNSDFQVKGTGTNQLFFDASTGRLGLNTNNPSTILHLIGRCANDTMKLESSTSCPTGVALTLYHSPSNGSEIGDYPATINLAGRNSNAQEINYAQIKSRILGTEIGATSGELIFSVDYSGVPTTIVTAHPKKITLGLDCQSSDRTNILIGNNASNSGLNNIVVGHATFISGVASSGNLVLGNSTNYIGSSSLVASHNSNISGSNLYVLGYDNNIKANESLILGSSSEVSGSFNISCGFDNAITSSNDITLGFNNNNAGAYSLVTGKDNDVINISGVAIGLGNSVSGNNILCYSIFSDITGSDNIALSISSDLSGDNNISIGQLSDTKGSNSISIGKNIVSNTSNSILIGQNLNSTTNDAVILGITNPDLVVSSQGVVINSGISNIDTIIYGNSASSGLFYKSNRLGINTDPSGFVLNVNGSARASSIYVDSLRVGDSSIENSILVSDDSGNASWQPASQIQESIVGNLAAGAMVYFNGTTLSSTTGLFWNAGSGVLFTQNSNTIIPTGNSAFLVNANRAALTNVFNIRGSLQDSLFVADGTNNRIGINVDTPSYTLHMSGTARFIKDSLSFVEKNDNQFIVAYDIGPGSPNRFSITSSGLIIDQTIAGTILPAQGYGSSFPTPQTAELIKAIVWDSNDGRLKRSDNIYAGYGNFNGSTDS